MRRLLPEPAEDVDPAEVYRNVDRPPPTGRPWVLANFVVSADGSAALHGRSGPLSTPADRALFLALRGAADLVLVGAGTVRIEGYGPARGDDPAPIAVVSRTLHLDFAGRFFTEARARPLVVTCAAADAERRAHADRVADVVVAGEDAVDLGLAVAELGQRGHHVVLCEGGPTLLGQLVQDELLDELCLTVSPLLAGGGGPRVTAGPDLDEATPLQLGSVLADDDGTLFLRYLRA